MIVEKMKVTDMYIQSGDCKYVTGNKRAARPATPEIKAMKAKDAVLGKDGAVITKAVPEVKAIPARAASEGSQEMWIWAASVKMLKEIEARMRDAGVNPVEGIALDDKLEKNYVFRGFDVSKKIGQCYAAINRQVFQYAFRKVKSKEHYNKLGAAVLKADKAEKNRKKAAAKKEKDEAAAKIVADKAAKTAEADKKNANADVKKKKKLSKNPAPAKKEGEDWPE